MYGNYSYPINGNVQQNLAQQAINNVAVAGMQNTNALATQFAMKTQETLAIS